MSSDGSVDSTGSRLRQFGLYRSIDARTEEFLRLSRRRQLRQGCACAAISTAVTVTIVIIVLLICEYMIVVETNTVQKLKKGNTSKRIQHNLPVADKLDRSDFGFDQDYYERMPLLLNALQDNSYDDPTAEMWAPGRKTIYSHRGQRMQVTASTPRKSFRKSSPKPFLFEYRSPYPRPFQKAVNVADSWTESYHNAQKLKNLNDIVKYLEKTLNAKFGDLYVPSESQIAFSNVYVPSSNQRYTHSKKTEKESRIDHYRNHHSDPLFSYKPDNPSDVNFLVDDSKLYFISRSKNFARISNKPVNKCENKDCARFVMNEKVSNSFNLDGVNNRLYGDTDRKKNIDPNHIYITTPRPLVQFKRKTIQPPNRYLFQVKRSKYDVTKDSNHVTIPKEKTTNLPRLILNLNVYSVKGVKDEVVTTPTSIFYDNIETTSASYDKYLSVNYSDQIDLNETSVEDFHVGSSGILPVYTQPSFPPTYPITTPIVPIFTTIDPVTYVPSTTPPEIFKFSPEDAKIPDQYLSLRKSDTSEETPSDLNNSQDEHNVKKQKDTAKQNQFNILRKSDVYKITTNIYDHSQLEDINDDKIEEEQEEKVDTLIIKLKNSIASTTQEYKTDTTENAATEETYVPQINGHYRNMKYKNLSALLKESSDRYRKRLENLTTKKPTYVPMLPDKHDGTDLL